MATTVAFTFGHGNFGKLWGMLYFVAGLLNFAIGPLAYLAANLRCLVAPLSLPP